MNQDGVSLILKYFPDLTDIQRDKFIALRELYEDLNEKINVISRKDIENLYERHILHSLAVAKIVKFEAGTRVLDVGTGGGFPGIPLAVLFPDCSFTLVDSIGKKITVVREVANAAGIENVNPLNIRAEKIKEDFDFITARAVTDIREFYIWVKDKISRNSRNSIKNGIITLKGGDLAEEMSQLKRHFEIFDIRDFFEEEFFETKKVVYIPQLEKKK
jgi:16S rRNA (guanine527-N7)-methyltransferase